MKKRSLLSVFLVGFLFALGLGISGMTQPQKVIGFLDLLGDWDPALVFVMVGAILVHGLLYPVITRRQSPLLTPDFQVPVRKDVTSRLVAGSMIFGVGWGLAGYCPGPGLTALVSLEMSPLIFVGFMVLGMLSIRPVDSLLGAGKSLLK